MSYLGASMAFVFFIASGVPVVLQAAPTTCDGVSALLTTPDVAAGSPIGVELTVDDDLQGKVSCAVQFIGEQGRNSILTSTYQAFSAAKTVITVKTKPTTTISNYKGTLLCFISDVQCDERVEGMLDLYAP
ncbi:hypothetical protein [Pseudomonas sp. MWU12-2029]|uniref:hypothetical protein n=1 Tax=Pseudomonas sp. MWU12-2029 TaxID=2927805 RepID=UPI00200F5D25|nr:hypothetical protein [Pseudomonas sp. MWU12-2029]